MAHANQKFQVIVFSGMNAVSFAAVACPVTEARRVKITNPDVADSIEVCTDPTLAGAVLTIPAGGSLEVPLSDKYIRGFQQGETVCYVRGAGDQPVIEFEV